MCNWLRSLGKPEEAIPIYKDVIARFPERAAGYTNHRLAEAYRKAGDAKSALEQDRIALEAMKEEPEDSPDLRQPLVGLGAKHHVQRSGRNTSPQALDHRVAADHPLGAGGPGTRSRALSRGHKSSKICLSNEKLSDLRRDC